MARIHPEKAHSFQAEALLSQLLTNIIVITHCSPERPMLLHIVLKQYH